MSEERTELERLTDNLKSMIPQDAVEVDITSGYEEMESNGDVYPQVHLTYKRAIFTGTLETKKL